ncbi:MAG: zinc-finger domain-containing protein [Bacillus sp. (in: firmicutes)]
MNLKRKGILNQIDHLTDNYCDPCHLELKDKHIYCRKECSVGKNLQKLGRWLDEEAKERRIQNILSKGQNIKKSDIKKLKEYGVSDSKIQQALRKGVEVVGKSKINMTVEEFVQWKHVKKFSYVEIGKKFGVGDAAIHMWKSKRAKEIEAAVKALDSCETQTDKIPPKQDKKPEYDHAMKELATKLTNRETALVEKDKLIASLKAKVEELESISEACGDVEEETAGLREEVTSLQDSLSKEIELTRELTARLEELTLRLEQKQSTPDLYAEENKALRNLVRLWI